MHFVVCRHASLPRIYRISQSRSSPRSARAWQDPGLACNVFSSSRTAPSILLYTQPQSQPPPDPTASRPRSSRQPAPSSCYLCHFPVALICALPKPTTETDGKVCRHCAVPASAQTSQRAIRNALWIRGKQDDTEEVGFTVRDRRRQCCRRGFWRVVPRPSLHDPHV